MLALPGCDLTTTIRRAEKIRKQICTSEISTDSRSVPVTISIGVDMASCNQPIDAQTVIGQAVVVLH